MYKIKVHVHVSISHMVHIQLIAVQEEYQREKEYLLHDIRELDKQVELQALIMDHYIPQEYQALIEQHVTWDTEEQEWRLVRSHDIILHCIHEHNYALCTYIRKYIKIANY